MPPKTTKKPRRWHCQGIPDGKKKCGNLALFGTEKFMGNGTWKVPVKVKLCMPCDKVFVTLTSVPELFT